MRPPALLLVVLVLALVGAGCGGDDEPAGSATAPDSTAAPESTSPAANMTEVEIADFKYLPDTIAVDAGAEVTFTNSDQAPHTATADDGSFNTDTLDQGESATVTLDKPGTYTYFCQFHAFMKASIEVS